MTKPTAGPVPATRTAKIMIIKTQDGEIISPRITSTANARLIAAAPELLAALQDCIDALVIHAPDTWVLTQARAVIAKATE